METMTPQEAMMLLAFWIVFHGPGTCAEALFS